MVIRATTTYQNGRVIDVVERHIPPYCKGDRSGGMSGGMKRSPKTQTTQEPQKKVNEKNRKKLCRQKLLANFSNGDWYITLTYRPENNPANLTTAKQDFSKFMRAVRKAYKNQGQCPRWIRNIELGADGQWHIHLVINNIGDNSRIIADKWKHGYVHAEVIRLDAQVYDEDFLKLANYLTKGDGPNAQNDQPSGKKENADQNRPKISSYSCSRGLKVPETEVIVLNHYPSEPEIIDGYYLAHCYEGRNPITGKPYREYTLVRLQKQCKVIDHCYRQQKQDHIESVNCMDIRSKKDEKHKTNGKRNQEFK
ncbi:MAG: hypothetical protein LUC83_04945 [Clostridiales bacterium]|nr:hypothetical protein [Clostridiales bacterium]